jgi:hypothetical protein
VEGFTGVVTFGFVAVGAAVFITAGAGAAGAPIAYPRNWHKLSKKALGMIEERKLLAHGLPWHIPDTTLVGCPPAAVP